MSMMQDLRFFLWFQIKQLEDGTLISQTKYTHDILKKSGMINRFEMSMMGDLRFYLWFQIKQLEDGILISQTKYTHDILKKYGMDKAKPIKTTTGTNEHLDRDMGRKSVDQKVYLSLIGSLQYICASRPDIMFSVCVCERFQAHPKSPICGPLGE
jgi:hypothetical protein